MATNEQDIKVTLSGETSTFTSAFNKAREDFKKAMDAIAQDSKSAKTQLESAFENLKLTNSAQLQADSTHIRTAFDDIRVSVQAMAVNMNTAVDSMTAKLKELGSEAERIYPPVNKVGDSFSNMGLKLGAAIAGVVSFAAAMSTLKQIFAETNTYEQTINILANTVGSATKAKEAYNQLAESANKLGLNQKDLTNQFSTFAASARGSSMEGANTMKVFNALTTTFAALHTPTAQVNEALLAVSQMMSKGKIEAQELRLQLGNALPGAFTTMAESMGKTSAELDKMLQNGQVGIENLLPFATKLNEIYGPNASNNVETFTGKWNILKNTIAQLFIDIGESGAMDSLKRVMQDIIDKINLAAKDGSLKAWAKEVGEEIAKLIKNLEASAEWLAKHKTLSEALVGIGLAAWVATVGAAFKDLFKVIGMVGTALGAIATFMVANPITIAILAITAGVGVLLNKITNVKPVTDEAANSVKDFAHELEKIKLSDSLGDSLAKNADKLKATLADIDKTYNESNAKIMEGDKAAAAEFDRQMQGRIDVSQRAHLAYIDQDNKYAEQEKALAQRKSLLEEANRRADEAASQKSIDREVALNKQKVETLNALEKKISSDKVAEQAIANAKISTQLDAYHKQIETDSRNSAIKVAKDKISSEEGVVKAIKDANAEVASSEKIANDKRVAAQKAAVDAITAQENALKREREKAKQDYINLQRQEVEESLRFAEQRRERLEYISFMISENAKSHNTERVKAEKAALDQGIRDLENASTTQIQLIKEAEDRKLEQIRSSGKSQQQIAKETQGVEEETSKKIVSAKEEELKGYVSAIQKQISEVAARNKKIKDLNDELAGVQKSYDKELFDSNLRKMDDAGKIAALQKEILAETTKAMQLGVEADAAQGAEKDKLLKQQKDLIEEARGYNKELDALGKTGKDATVAQSQATLAYKNNLVILRALSEDAIKSQIDLAKKQNESAEKAGGTIDELKTKAKSLAEELKTLGQTEVKIKAIFDPEALTVLNAEKEKLKTPEDKPIFPKLDSDSINSAKAAIAELTKTETKTIVVNEVAGTKIATDGTGTFDNRPSGFSMFADGGLISGPGTGTSDSIPALVSNGEYVVKASAVQRFGSNFFNALNSGFLPAMASNTPRFADGGLVGGSSSRSDTVNINIALGGRSYAVQGAREQAMGLASALQALSRAA